MSESKSVAQDSWTFKELDLRSEGDFIHQAPKTWKMSDRRTWAQLQAELHNKQKYRAEIKRLRSAQSVPQDVEGWSGWACQYPDSMPRLYGAKTIAEVNLDPENGDRLLFLAEQHLPIDVEKWIFDNEVAYRFDVETPYYAIDSDRVRTFLARRDAGCAPKRINVHDLIQASEGARSDDYCKGLADGHNGCIDMLTASKEGV